MNDEQVETFLAGSCLARLACLQPDGSPYVIPIWYHWADGRLWFVGREKSAWCTYLDRDPRVAVTIDTEGEYEVGGVAFLTPKVVAAGKAEIVSRPGDDVRWQEIALAMARRYRGEAGVEYVKNTTDMGRWLIALEPETMQTWEGGGWAKRYRN